MQALQILGAHFPLDLDPASGPTMVSRAMSNCYRIGQFARLAGVTVRALHHYDRMGLLKPQRGTSGFRLYCPEDLERLEQIAALKFLGIPLHEIKLLLKHGPLKLVDSLHMQREALAEKRKLIDRAMVAIAAAEKVIQSGQTTDASILRKIIEVIDMQPQEKSMRKYYTEQAWLDRERIRQQTPLETRQKNVRAMRQVFSEIEAAIDLDPASERAQYLTKQWLQLAEYAHGGNEAVRAGNTQAWNDFQNWPRDEQDKLLAAFDLDLNDRAASMLRFESVTKFLGRAVGHKIRSSIPSIRTLYGLDQA
ncbi:Transcriptional regulator, MerR family (modular protein) [Candidatus Sulfotelmatomonas gaucii]|uniref:Transcriptional regulator, MerR family (Modular protein) n=1 Tax=Candidatus Sulfuritelmatomonas gaucii TaxID=2043161 RepID=A0A2N9MAF4_9BACT|nr:Transcriptional regulator, MerR family (modular protein) [Candidatus Sulfotelmatomonas gaucii]